MIELSKKEKRLKEVVEAYLENGKNARKASASINMPRTTFRRVLAKAKKHIDFADMLSGIKVKIDSEVILKSEKADLKKEINRLSKELISSEKVKQYIYKLKESKPSIPEWLRKSIKSDKTTGVPSLALSDWHFGEVVDEKQVMMSNKFNLEIARKRVERVIKGAIDLAFNHIANPDYPGIVVPLLGDFVAGLIHEELKITAEKDVLEVQLELLGIMIKAIKELANAFGKVFIPCVAGNHGRLTLKPKSKGYAHDSLDWHLYCLLDKFFEEDDRIVFHISDGEDQQYKIYNWTYRITHGSQFKGGDGIIGPLGPVTRGDMRKRSQARSLNNEYDFLILGHFHQTIFLNQRVIVNSSIVGMSEYAFKGMFCNERPSQSFWVTHPENGITFQLPVFADDIEENISDKKWVSWEE